MKMYMVMNIKKELNAEIFGLKVPVSMVWAKGQVGVFPVFENKKDADAYANDYGDVVEIKRVTNDQ
jgi:hypothetical protein